MADDGSREHGMMATRGIRRIPKKIRFRAIGASISPKRTKAGARNSRFDSFKEIFTKLARNRPRKF